MGIVPLAFRLFSRDSAKWLWIVVSLTRVAFSAVWASIRMSSICKLSLMCNLLNREIDIFNNFVKILEVGPRPNIRHWNSYRFPSPEPDKFLKVRPQGDCEVGIFQVDFDHKVLFLYTAPFSSLTLFVLVGFLHWNLFQWDFPSLYWF